MPATAPSRQNLSPSAAASSAAPASSRVVSLDVFRGLNIALMIFVNELAEVKGLPWWTYHAPGRADVMTYVDMVFPGFLLILGMSLPLAIRGRVRRGEGTLRLLGYVVLRAAALLVLGLIVANAGRGESALMHGLGPYAWGLLALAAAFMVWLDDASGPLGRSSRWPSLLRWTGVILLVLLAVIFRRTGRDGGVHWLSYEYPEILGLIGYTYFAGAVCYVLTRRWRWAPAGWFLLFTLFNALASAKIVHAPWMWYRWPFANGAMLSLTFAGVLLSTIFFLEPALATFRARATAALAFAAVCLPAALLLRPLGISKIRATPTWTLGTIAACCLLYTLLYRVCDVKGWTRWAAPVRSAGSNTLLTYLLPDIWFYLLGLLGIHWFSTHLAEGAPGVVRALDFTALMLLLSTLLTRARVRLQL